MTDTAQKANKFKSLHIKGDPLVLYNIWDAGTAKIVADSGAAAIATGSWAVAAANGYGDGEKLDLEIALHNLKAIVNAVDLPVTIDLESGYGPDPQQVGANIARAIDAGAVGFNLEDQIIGENALFTVADQAARITASRKAIDATGIAAFINARSDVFMQADPGAEPGPLLDEVIKRAQAYHLAGADGLFVPGLINEAAIKTLSATSPLPLNIMMMPKCPDRETLANLGVARISLLPKAPKQSIRLRACRF